MLKSREENISGDGNRRRTICFRGQEYYDDRLSLLCLCPATVKTKPDENGVIWTTIYHEHPPDDHIWCVAFYRNCTRYPLFHVAHFFKKEDATAYLKEIEPQTPLISLNGNSPLHPASHEEFLAWKAKNNLKEYDFKALCLSGGTNAVEIIGQTKEQFKEVRGGNENA